MNAAHTPGPWRVLEDGCTEEEGNRCRPLTICCPQNNDLANVYSSDDATVSILRPEAIANARIMAAAQGLLKALRDLELGANTVDFCYTRNPANFAAALRDLREYAEAARAAIAAATQGGQA